MVSQRFFPFGIPAYDCGSFGCGNAQDCLDVVQGLQSLVACFRGARFLRWPYVYSMRKSKKELLYFPSTVISKCRKWHLTGTYLSFFPGVACPRIPLEVHTCSNHGQNYARPKTAFFVVNRAGISENGILFKIQFCRLVNYSTSLVAPGMGYFLLFPTRMVGHLSLLALYQN